MPNCPTNVPQMAGQGLKGTDRCAFPIQDDDTWVANNALVDQITAQAKLVTLGDILLGDLNRTGTSVSSVPGNVSDFRSGFQWENGDENVAYWVPQGLTLSADANDTGAIAGRKVAIVSWYYDKSAEPNSPGEKGVRIAIVDPTTPSNIRYRFVLLVEPVAGNPATFKAIPIHAGGLAWFDHWLYVVDTNKGFRVFDTNRILKVDASKDEIGYDASTNTYHAASYAYALPQVDSFTLANACGQIFSYVSVDRSTTPPTLLSGEYCSSTACSSPLAGRLFRYKLGADGRLASGKSWPSDAEYMGETQVQGAASYGGRYYLSSSAPAAGAGELFVVPTAGPSKSVGWIDAPEDLAFDPMQMRLWGLSEAEGARFVFSVDPSGY